MNHAEKSTIVESTQVGIYQHDLYSWQVLGNRFVVMKELSNESEFINKTLKEWLKGLTEEQRKKFWVALFEILSSTNAETLSEIIENWFNNSKVIMSTYKNLDDESKGVIIKTTKALFDVMKENLKPGKNKNQL